MSRKIVKQGIVAAIYVVLGLVFLPFGTNAVQVRIAEIMLLFPARKKDYIWGVTVGCLITNAIGGHGLPDVIFGTLATLIAAVLVAYIPQKWAWPVVAAIPNGLIVGAMLVYLRQSPWGFPLTALSVGAGEFVSVLIGVLLLPIFEKQKWYAEL